MPAKAGIQFFQALSGFRVKLGMTDKGIMLVSTLLTFEDPVTGHIHTLAQVP